MSARRCQKQGRALIALNRKSVEYIRLLVMAGRNALRFFGRHLHQRLFGFRFGVRLTRLGRDLSVRPRLGLSREYSLRCHVGRGCWRGGKSFCRIIIIPGCWQTGALAGDYHRRIALLERRIRNEQQRHQHRTYHCKKGENWHWRPRTKFEQPPEARRGSVDGFQVYQGQRRKVSLVSRVAVPFLSLSVVTRYGTNPQKALDATLARPLYPTALPTGTREVSWNCCLRRPVKCVRQRRLCDELGSS
jgi:hypothetical protein